MDDREAWIRRSAVGGLAAFNLPRTIDWIIKALDDPDAGVRGEVARSLGEYGRTTDDVLVKRIVAALVVKLTDQVDQVLSHTAWSLGVIGRRASNAIDALTQLTNHANPHVRQAATAALWHINDKTRN